MSKKKQYHLLLKQLRIQAGLTQTQVARKVDEPQSYVSKYESGEQRLDLNEVHMICTAIDISLIDFIRKFLDS